jgi:hypothetical protein
MSMGRAEEKSEGVKRILRASSAMGNSDVVIRAHYSGGMFLRSFLTMTPAVSASLSEELGSPIYIYVWIENSHSAGAQRQKKRKQQPGDIGVRICDSG